MMGVHVEQKSLFSYSVNLEKRIRSDNPLRRIAEVIDFSFVRDEVRDLYGHNGHESVDPEIILKLIFLLFLDDVKSERELMRIVPERLDYLWFLGEGRFGQAAENHHFKRSRWRRLWRQKIQDDLIASIQNIKILIKYGKPKSVKRQNYRQYSIAINNHFSHCRKVNFRL